MLYLTIYRRPALPGTYCLTEHRMAFVKGTRSFSLPVQHAKMVTGALQRMAGRSVLHLGRKKLHAGQQTNACNTARPLPSNLWKQKQYL